MSYKRVSPMPVIEGGTNATSMTNTDGVVFFNGTSLVTTAVGTATHVLTSNGAGNAPTFQAGGGGGGITTITGNTGSATGANVTLTGGTSGAIFTGSGSTVTESFNFLALPATTSTNGQIRIGSDIVLWAPFNQSNTFVGGQAGNSTLTNFYNTGVGWQSGISLTSGTQNAFFGALCGDSVTSGSDNVAIGYNALATATTDSQQLAIGTQSLAFLNGSTQPNTALGHKQLFNLTTGGYNVCIGTAAGGGAYNGAESNNILINNYSSALAGESNALRIGNGTGAGLLELNKSFIHGIRGITTIANDAIAVLVSSTGQLGTVSSSIRYKENVVDMGDASSPVLSLRPVSFDFIGKPSYKKQIGLIAEEVKEIMPDLVVHNIDGEVESVKYHELPILLLNELQKAIKRIEQLEAKLSSNCKG